MMTLTWCFMITTALMLLEANLWMPAGSHIITMAGRLLGPFGKATAWILYLFMAYASLIAYTSAAGGLLQEIVPDAGPWLCNLLFILIFIRIDLRSSRRCFDRFNLLVYSFWLSLRLLNWWAELLKLLRYFLRRNVWYSLRLLNRLRLLLRLPTSNFLLRRYFNLDTFRHF